jgi:hypothetical protein
MRLLGGKGGGAERGVDEDGDGDGDGLFGGLWDFGGAVFVLTLK